MSWFKKKAVIKKVKYTIFVEMSKDKVITIKEEFDEDLTELGIALMIKMRRFIKMDHTFYNTDNIVGITIRKTEP